VSNDLKTERLKMGLTQNDVAKQLGISPITYQRYESNKRIPDVQIAINLARIYNTDVESIFTP